MKRFLFAIFILSLAAKSEKAGYGVNADLTAALRQLIGQCLIDPLAKMCQSDQFSMLLNAVPNSDSGKKVN